MKNKTTYLFGEKSTFKKAIRKFKDSESMYDLFDSYFLQLDLLKYKLFGEDFENFGDIIIKGQHHSPRKINLDFLVNHLTETKLFQEIYTNYIKQHKRKKWRTPSKNDIKIFLNLLITKTKSPINFYKMKNMPLIINNRFVKKPDKNANKFNKTNFSRNTSLKFSPKEKSFLSFEKTSNLSEIPPKISLSPPMTPRYKIIKSNNNENQISKFNKDENNSIPKKISLSPTRNKFKAINIFDKLKYIKDKQEKKRKDCEKFIIKKKLNFLEKKAKSNSVNFKTTLSERNSQKAQFNRRFKFLISKYNQFY